MSTPRYTFAGQIQANRIDKAGGIIFGVAVITQGPALGHGMNVDAKTLEQVAVSAATYANGLKVKMTHAGDAGDIVGYLTGFRVDGETLRADFHLLKTSPHRDYILEIAETIPDTFGMSISFSGPTEAVNGQSFARCSEIYSCDLVSEPAANPSGLFSVGEQPNQSIPMNPEDIKKIVTECMAGFEARLAKLETPVVPAPEVEIEKEIESPEMSAKIKAAVELAARESALATIKQFSLAAPAPAAVSAPVTTPAVEGKKSFEVIVRELKAGGMKHNDALKQAMESHETEYNAYTARVQSGEVILF